MPLMFISIIFLILKIDDLENIVDVLGFVYFYFAVIVLFMFNYIPVNKKGSKIKFFEKQICHVSFLFFFIWCFFSITKTQAFKIEFLLYYGFFIITMLIYFMEYNIIKWRPKNTNIVIKTLIVLFLSILLLIISWRVYNSLSKIF